MIHNSIIFPQTGSMVVTKVTPEYSNTKKYTFSEAAGKSNIVLLCNEGYNSSFAGSSNTENSDIIWLCVTDTVKAFSTYRLQAYYQSSSVRGDHGLSISTSNITYTPKTGALSLSNSSYDLSNGREYILIAW